MSHVPKEVLADQSGFRYPLKGAGIGVFKLKVLVYILLVKVCISK